MPESYRTERNQVLDASRPAWWQKAVLLPRSGPRVVRITGPDAWDLLQRLTTNDMRTASAEMAVVTALLTPKGKIRSVFIVVAVDDGYLLIAGPGESVFLREMLQQQIFFMDDVRVTDVSDDWQVFQLAGKAAGQTMEECRLGWEGSDWQDGMVHHAGSMHAFWMERLELPSLYLLCPASEAKKVEEALAAAGAPLLDHENSYQLQRILAQRAGYGRELQGDCNPLEIGLAWICAENKGCYPGQEVIARQITYGKVTRRLVLLRLPQGVAPKADVHVDKIKVGTVSSTACETPGEAGYGLAVLRSAHIAGRKQVTVQGEPAFICGSNGQ